jgi:transglutaminase-like putative cysteine protease
VPAADFEHDLAAAPLVQADDPRIQTLANELTAKARSPRARVQAIMDWMAANIEKRPVLSLPDAVNTLTQRMGDCNEHAVLLAALARAAGIPTQIEAGLVYQRGRFYYHAWNRVHLGRWVTVDALMGQMPADVTHIRLARGDLSEQMEILPMIGRLAITILEAERTS